MKGGEEVEHAYCWSCGTWLKVVWDVQNKQTNPEKPERRQCPFCCGVGAIDYREELEGGEENGSESDDD